MSTTSYHRSASYQTRAGGVKDPPLLPAWELSTEGAMRQRGIGAREQTGADGAWRAVPVGTETPPGSDAVLRRMNEIQHLGTVDSLDGCAYLYTGPVGEGADREVMSALIYEHAGDVCILFWADDGRLRRLLVTARGDVWIAVALRSVRHAGKYLRAWWDLVKVRVVNRTRGEDAGEVARG